MKKATIRSAELEKRPPEQSRPESSTPASKAALPSLDDLLATSAPQRRGRHADPLRALDLSAPRPVPVQPNRPRKAPVTLGDLGLARPSGKPKEEIAALAASIAARNQLTNIELAASLRQVADAIAPAEVPQAQVLALPSAAPEAWAKRDLNLRETPPRFIARVYAPWVGRGLTRKDLKTLDPELYRALSVWLTRHPEEDIAAALPRKSDKLDELIDKLAAEHSLEDLRKLGYAIDARLKREAKRLKIT